MKSHPLKRPIFMGILNVTPDSFSDGGLHFSLTDALARAEKLVQDGTDILDVGGESTRPGAIEVPEEEEIRRVIPVIEAITKRFPVRVSIDTRKSKVAKAAMESGATLINDVSGGSDVGMVALLKDPKIEMILMHMKGTPQTMQEEPSYPNGVVSEVRKFFDLKLAAFAEMGISKNRLWIDPGIGFGKTVNHNLDLLRHLKDFSGVGGKLVIGTSRKAFLGKISGTEAKTAQERLPGTLTTTVWAYANGAEVLRVHDLKEVKAAIETYLAVQEGIPQ